MKKRTFFVGVLFVVGFVFCSIAGAGNQPSFEADWYGFIKLDGSWDQNVTSHGNFVMWVNPRQNGNDNEQFNMTANQSLIGVALEGTGYRDVRVNGRVEFDLYGDVSGSPVQSSRTSLMLRHAYFTVQSGNTRFLAGQSNDLISPLDPPTLNYGVLWGCGNTGYRRAQVSLWQTVAAGDRTEVTLAGGLFRTIGDDLTPTFSLAAGEAADGLDDGTDAAIPSFQGRLDIQHELPNGNYLRTGFSGLWGQLKAATNLGNYQTYETWAVVGHVAVPLAAGFGFAGEVFTGSNLGNYLAGILNQSTIEGVPTTGGWVSAWVNPAPRVQLAAGYGVDDPDDNYLAAQDRCWNSCLFGNVTYAFVPQAKVGLEISQWRTDYKSTETAENLRAQTSFILSY